MPKFRSTSRAKQRGESLASELRAIFDLFDTDGNGYIDERELLHFFRQGYIHLSSELTELMNEADFNNDGYIDFEEFLAIFKQANNGSASAKWQVANTLIKELIDSQKFVLKSLAPLHESLQNNAVSSGLSPRATSVNGNKERRSAPRAARFCAECLDCCVITPILGVFFFLLLLPVMIYVTDDIYRIAKDSACASPSTTTAFGAVWGTDQVSAWCDPSGGCPESYDMLQIEKTASSSEIRRAYRKATLRYHPDKVCTSSDTTDMESCEEKYTALFICLTEAKATLLDSEKRAYYDQFGNLDEMEHFMTKWTWPFIVVAGNFLTFQLALAAVMMCRCFACGCRGQGSGKYLLGLQVVNVNGLPGSCRTMFVRTLLKLFGVVLTPVLLVLANASIIQTTQYACAVFCVCAVGVYTLYTSVSQSGCVVWK